jgi:hypothetical protein
VFGELPNTATGKGGNSFSGSEPRKPPIGWHLLSRVAEPSRDPIRKGDPGVARLRRARSALGQSRRFCDVGYWSAYPSIADFGSCWAEPRLVAEIAYSNWTSDRVMRHPKFVALREDKPTRELVLENPVPYGHLTSGPRSSR